VHDGVFFEDVGIPAATVVSSEFVRAAGAQAAALGALAYRTVTVPHPIQTRTRDELRELADHAFPAILVQLTEG
jgi:hypothetical protein